MSPGPDSPDAVDRATTALGAVSIVFAGFVFAEPLPSEFDFVDLDPLGAIVLVVCGVLAIIGGTLQRASARIVAGGLLTTAALVQLAGIALAVRPLGGDASAMALIGGLGLGLLALSLSSIPRHAPRKGR